MKDNNSLFVVESTNMSVIGITYMSLRVATFKSLKSTQTLSFPFFFHHRENIFQPLHIPYRSDEFGLQKLLNLLI